MVSHSGFLRVGVSYSRYENADFRIFEFAEGEGNDDLELVEWEATEVKGGGLGKSDRGHFPMLKGDNIPDAKVTRDDEAGEVAKEIPTPASKV